MFSEYFNFKKERYKAIFNPESNMPLHDRIRDDMGTSFLVNSLKGRFFNGLNNKIEKTKNLSECFNPLTEPFKHPYALNTIKETF